MPSDTEPTSCSADMRPVCPLFSFSSTDMRNSSTTPWWAAQSSIPDSSDKPSSFSVTDEWKSFACDERPGSRPTTATKPTPSLVGCGRHSPGSHRGHDRRGKARQCNGQKTSNAGWNLPPQTCSPLGEEISPSSQTYVFAPLPARDVTSAPRPTSTHDRETASGATSRTVSASVPRRTGPSARGPHPRLRRRNSEPHSRRTAHARKQPRGARRERSRRSPVLAAAATGRTLAAQHR